MTQTQRWKLNRAGLFNFWYYDDETFDFADGKLLLKGANGSGKSVTMQSLITVLLDGRTNPNRLDPFGTTARHMSDYLLGEKDITNHDERTGYLFLEYHKPGTDAYLTTAIGLQARRANNDIKFWGFILKDGVRIGQNFALYKWEHSSADGKPQKIPLSKRELERQIEPGKGQLTTHKGEYAALVNRHLFGFETTESYQDLIKLMLQLRSPKLSKAFKPSVIYDILHDALTPLSDDNLRGLSDTIDAINQARDQLGRLREERGALVSMRGPYDRYNRVVLYEKADALIRAQQRAGEYQRQLQEADDKAKRQTHEQERLADLNTQLERELKVTRHEHEEWRNHDVFKAEQQKRALEIQISAQDKTARSKQTALQRKTQQLHQLDTHTAELKTQNHRTQIAVLKSLDEMAEPASQAAFADHNQEADHLRRRPHQDPGFAAWQAAAETHRRELQQVLNLLRQVTRQEERHSEARAEVDRVAISLAQARELEQQRLSAFEEVREHGCDQVEIWIRNHPKFQLTPEEIAAAKQALLDLYETTWPNVLAPIESAHTRLNEQLLQAEAQINQQHGELEARKRELEAEKKEWENLRDPEPPRHKETLAARQILKAQNTAHIPFFHAVEFKPHVNDTERERIEAALLSSRILDALILPRNAKPDIASDHIVSPKSPVKGPSLAQVLTPTPVPGSGIHHLDIQAVLESIPYKQADQNAGAVINPDGGYRIGPLRGHAPPEETAVYIGKQAREAYRERRINQLMLEIEQTRDALFNLEVSRDQHRKTRQSLKQARSDFPAEAPIRQAFDQLEAQRRDVAALHREADRADQRFKDTLAKLRELIDSVRHEARHIKLVKEESVFAGAVEAVNQYISLLANLNRDHSTLLHTLDKIKNQEQQRGELALDFEILSEELEILQEELAEKRLTLAETEKRLAAAGVDKIRSKVAQLARRLEEIPKQTKDVFQNLARVNAELQQYQEQRQVMVSNHRQAQTIHHTWRNVFNDELQLKLARGFDYQTLPTQVWEPLPADGIDQDKDPLLRAARQLSRELPDLARKTERSRAMNNLNSGYNSNRSQLLEYDPKLNEHQWPQARAVDIEDGPHRVYFEELQSKIPRMDLMLRYNGVSRDLHGTLNAIEQHIEEQEQVLTERDRKLYEEVILNNIGDIITSHVHRTRQWVVDMNQLMSQRDISSGLVFSLEWKPKTGDRDDEMDTDHLVELLTMDRHLIPADQFQRLIQHFQSKLGEARRLTESGESTAVFHQEVKRVLDYRNWFQFKLHFRKPDKPRRELTDKAFGTFSGGEKAMAMYIPLFSATYSRYQAASPDAPRLITLDEAFAGVDENNIREMFDLMSQLDFDYIINSQILWGDFDTVKELAIVQLNRPKDQDYVVPMRYKWNGFKLQLEDHDERSHETLV